MNNSSLFILSIVKRIPSSLIEKKNSIIKKLIVNVFPQVKLHFTENALHLVAKKAAAKETGARGLRSIMKDILTEATFDVNFYLNFSCK